MAAIWAQEYWEWRLHALNALLCLTIVLAPFAIWNDIRNAANREIFSHAITYQAARMLNLPMTEDEMVGSLTVYSYCKGISRAELLSRMRAFYPRARAWAESHRAKIVAIQRLDAPQ